MATVTSHPDQKHDRSGKLTTMLMNPLRTPPIYADLLPTEVFISRRTRQIGRYAVFALVLVTVLLGLWYGTEVLRTGVQENERDDVLDRVQSIRAQQARFDDLVGMQRQSAAIQTQLATLMANDLVWSNLTGAVAAAAGDEIDLIGLTAGVPAAGAALPTTPNLIGPPSVKTIGTLTITGVGPDKGVIARYVDALDEVPGLANAFLTNASQGENGVEFTVRVDITAGALDNRYRPSASAGPVR